MELFIVTIAWLFGILLGLYLKIGIVLLVVLSSILYFYRRKKTYFNIFFFKKHIILFIICLTLSFLQITYFETSFQEKYKNIEEIEVIGTIVSNGVKKEYNTTYIVKVEEINKSKAYKNTHLLLKVKNEKTQIKYNYGNKISFNAKFTTPEVQRNEGGFNYKEYLKTKNIYGIVSTNIKQIKLEKENNINAILKITNTFANKIEEKANELLSEKEASLLTGILIGRKENLEDDVQTIFRKSSLSHMLAVSGAHVSYVIMGIGFIIAKSKIAKNIGKIITILLLIVFIFLTGQTPSVTRACIMSIYLIIGSILHKKVSTIASISLSFLILLILNPYCILDIGLQLSYGGTIGIVLVYPQLNKWLAKKEETKSGREIIKKVKNKVKELILITLSANIILIPIMLYHYNTVSFNFVISNLLASPIMGVLIIVGFISIISYSIFPFFKILFSIPLSFLVNLFLNIATFTSNLPGSQLIIITPKIEVIFIYYSILFIYFYYKKLKEKSIKRKIEKSILKKFEKITKKKVIAIILILTTIFLFYKQIPKNLKINFIDVGQGDSTLVVTPKNKTILIDGGGSKKKELFDVGKETLIPFLLDKGITKLNYIIISHFDSDHVRTVY